MAGTSLHSPIEEWGQGLVGVRIKRGWLEKHPIGPFHGSIESDRLGIIELDDLDTRIEKSGGLPWVPGARLDLSTHLNE